MDRHRRNFPCPICDASNRIGRQLEDLDVWGLLALQELLELLLHLYRDPDHGLGRDCLTHLCALLLPQRRRTGLQVVFHLETLLLLRLLEGGKSRECRQLTE